LFEPLAARLAQAVVASLGSLTVSAESITRLLEDATYKIIDHEYQISTRYEKLTEIYALPKKLSESLPLNALNKDRRKIIDYMVYQLLQSLKKFKLILKHFHASNNEDMLKLFSMLTPRVYQISKVEIERNQALANKNFDFFFKKPQETSEEVNNQITYGA
jgi:hypothetical protein